LGTFLGLQFTLLPSAIFALGLLWTGFAWVGIQWLNLPAFQAVAGGLIVALLHWVGEVWHQYGHALAARQVGYPMRGIEFWWFLGRSVYPVNEPKLPARVHIRRALGGTPASLLLTLLAGGLALGLRELGGLGYWLALFSFLENLLVFTLGAFLPLGFTDGSTLLRYWGKE
jgi:hypothetical protein